MLVNISILEATHIVSPTKCNISKIEIFAQRKHQQDTEGIQNMSGVYLIDLVFI